MATCLICVFSVFSPDSEAIGVLTSSIGWVGYVHLGAGMLVLLQAQGAAIRVACALGGAAAGCRCKVLLRGDAVRVAYAICAVELACPCRCRVSMLGAAVECIFRVLLSECCVRFGAGLLVPLQGAGAGYYCAS